MHLRKFNQMCLHYSGSEFLKLSFMRSTFTMYVFHDSVYTSSNKGFKLLVQFCQIHFLGVVIKHNNGRHTVWWQMIRSLKKRSFKKKSAFGKYGIEVCLNIIYVIGIVNHGSLLSINIVCVFVSMPDVLRIANKCYA